MIDKSKAMVLIGLFLNAIVAYVAIQNRLATLSFPADVCNKTVADVAPASVSNGVPTLYLHFGPEKTGSTTLQCMFTKTRDLLESETSYRYLGRVCGRLPLEERENSGLFLKTIASTYEGTVELTEAALKQLRESKSPIFSQETLSNQVYRTMRPWGNRDYYVGVMIDEIKKAGFPVKPIVVYRRLYSWVPSYQSERSKLYANADCRESLIKWFDIRDPFWDCNASRETNQHPVQYLLDGLSENFGLDDVSIFNMHAMTEEDAGDIYHSFVRELLPDSDSFRKKYREEYEMESQNTAAAKTTDLWHLASRVAGMKYGDSADDDQRAELHKRIHKKRVVRFFDGEDNIPTVCFSDDQLSELLEMSLRFEKELLPEWFAMDGVEDDHRKGFQEYVDRGKYCEWDVEKMMENERLREWALALQ